jgi:anaerobic selenocysteine-containing dehydrogenase
MRQLAKRLGMTADWLYQDPWPALEKAFAHTYRDGGLQKILAGEVLEVKLRPNDAYQTPSDKIEFAATGSLNEATPLPTQLPLPRSGSWLVLLNSSTAKYTHSQFTDVFGPIPQVVWVHPADAGQRSIKDNDRVAVFNELAVVTLHAKVTDKVLTGTLWAPRPLTGLNGVPLNALVPGDFSSYRRRAHIQFRKSGNQASDGVFGKWRIRPLGGNAREVMVRRCDYASSYFFVDISSCCPVGTILFLQLSQCFFQNGEPLFVFGVS